MNYILIHGYKGSGKSTLAVAIHAALEKSGFTAQIRPLADPAREALSRAFNIDVKYFEDEVLKNQPCEQLGDVIPRDMMQPFATEFAHSVFGKTVWCKAIHNMVNRNPTDFVIIPDVRFDHEYDYFQDAVTVDQTIFIEREGQVMSDTHISEAGLMHLYEPDNDKHTYVKFPNNTSQLEFLDYALNSFLPDNSDFGVISHPTSKLRLS